MKRKNSIWLCIFLSCFVMSCTKVLDVTVPTQEDKIVIEGLVTTQTQPFVVKVSKTIALGDTSSFPKVNNAIVVIADNTGNRDTLKLVTPGVYETASPRTGVVGRTYMITVTVAGITYSGQDRLYSVSPIDSLYAIYLTAGSGVGITDNGYYVFYNSTDPPGVKNYYLDKVFRNGLSVLNPSQIVVYNDQFLSPVLIGVRLPGKYNMGDHVVFELYSLSENAYTFYNGLNTQLQNDGGFFSTPPANAVSNLSNGALGFFQASDVSIDSLIVP
jgi:hypothetical protein